MYKRQAAGHSIGLKDEQIMELGKLDKGVAAVFQNDWLETVLTKIDKCSDKYEVSGVKKNDIPVSYTHLDVYKRQVEHLISQLLKLTRTRSTSWEVMEIMNLVEKTGMTALQDI